jgi:hypothetical protein
MLEPLFHQLLTSLRVIKLLSLSHLNLLNQPVELSSHVLLKDPNAVVEQHCGAQHGRHNGQFTGELVNKLKTKSLNNLLSVVFVGIRV